MSDTHEEAHTGPIKNPKQLLVTVLFSFVLPIFAILLAVTLFWQPARDLFGFAALDPVFMAVPPLAGLAVLVSLEMVKPIWRRSVRVGTIVQG